MGQVLQEMAFWTKRKMVFWNRKMAAKRKQASPVVASQKGYFVYFFGHASGTGRMSVSLTMVRRQLYWAG